METAPLNQAHCNERKAEKHIRNRRYDEAIHCLEEALALVAEAYTAITLPIGLQVLEVQAREYQRKILLINIRKLQEGGGHKSEEVVQRQKLSRSPSCSSGNEAGAGSPPKVDIANEVIAGEAIDEGNGMKKESAADWMQEVPSLAPLELPSLDFTMLKHVGSEHGMDSLIYTLSQYKVDATNET